MILFLVACINVSFLSCNSDDKTPENPLVGKWQVYKYGGDGEQEVEVGECEKKSVLELKSDNTFNNDKYESIGNDCILENFQGTWVDNGNNVLEVVREEKTRESKYFFENGNLKIVFSNEEGETYTIYKRL